MALFDGGCCEGECEAGVISCKMVWGCYYVLDVGEVG
jgi:hypothetical protein